MSSTTKFVIGAVVVALVLIGWFAFSVLGDSSSDYLTIAEVKALGPDQTRNSRVAGEIVPNSVEWSTRDLHLTFAIADETGVPLNTVRTRILRARRALRDELEESQ